MPPRASRLFAAASLLMLVATVATTLDYTIHHIGYAIAAIVGFLLSISAAWMAIIRRRGRRWAIAASVALLGGAIAALVAAGDGVAALVGIGAGILFSSAFGSRALRREFLAAATPWRDVPPARRGVLLMNPRSGGGKVERSNLDKLATARNIEAVTLQPGDDLGQLAQTAVHHGADVIGMAGGDGSQALVATVAARHGIPFVCVPAGTRNHLALDLGVDRRDVVGALDAFDTAREATIDLATVNGRIFVNNVSMGMYAQLVAYESYREAKGKTVLERLPSLVGADADPTGLHLHSPDGPVDDPELIQISNNPYMFSSMRGFGCRPRMDRGLLGIVTLKMDAAAHTPTPANSVMNRRGSQSWTATALEVTAGGSVPAAIDGEACVLEPPLRFAVLPGALRVRVAHRHPGFSPALIHPPMAWATLLGMILLTAGRPSGLLH